MADKLAAKVRIGALARRTGLIRLANARLLRKMPYIRAVSYHWTPTESAATLERHFRFFQERYESIDRPKLDAFLAGILPLSRPGLILTFDDGARNNREVAAPLLERFGLTGWFFIVPYGCAPDLPDIGGGANKAFCMSWEEVADLKQRGHEIGCHSLSHRNLGEIDSRDLLVREVVECREMMERRLGATVESFAYPIGSRESYSRESLDLLRQHYRYVFNSCPAPIRPGHSRSSLGRVMLDLRMDVGTVEFFLAGFEDLIRRPVTRYFARLERSLSDG